MWDMAECLNTGDHSPRTDICSNSMIGMTLAQIINGDEIRATHKSESNSILLHLDKQICWQNGQIQQSAVTKSPVPV